jgi:NADH dehydrogenase FAD-containing subunit
MLLPSSVVGIQDDCIGVDKDKGILTLKSNEVVDYDYLVFATGSIPDTYHIQMKYSCKNSMWYFFKDKSDLETLMTVLKVVGLNDIVIMGGGITGVELASELSRRMSQEQGVDRRAKTVTIVEPGDRLLPKMNEAMSKVVTEHLTAQNVEILTNSVITAAEEGVLKIVRNGNEALTLKAVIAVWTCGVKADELAMRCIGHNTVLDTLHLPHLTSPLLEATSPAEAPAPSGANIFAIGDCNNLLPKSAQNAKQQGVYLANYFNSGFQPSTPGYKFSSQGTMIRLADRIYMDSPLYSGFLPLWVHRLIIGLDI